MSLYKNQPAPNSHHLIVSQTIKHLFKAYYVPNSVGS